VRGQRIDDWQNRPAKQREKRGARAKKLAPTASPHWASSEREREREESAGRAHAAAPGGLVWAELAFSISLEFLIAFLFPFL
jgi:hypothetical protein